MSVENTASAAPAAKTKPRYFELAHIAGILAAILAYLAIFTITGDSDLFYAIGSGIGVWLVAWSAAALHWHWT